MSKWISKLATVGFAAVAFVVVASAAPVPAAEPAVVTRSEDGCAVNFGAWSGAYRLHNVQTSSGNENYSCHGQVPAGTEPDKAVVFKDLLCGGFSGIGDLKILVSAGGMLNATCKIRT